MTAVVAADPSEAVGEYAAFEVAGEGVLNESRQFETIYVALTRFE